jgi:phosphatidylinositol alpha-1,6-mannosyltransferase
VILTVSRIDAADHYKGHDKVIRAMKEVRIRHPDAAYIIVGRGDNRKALQRLAAEESVIDSVRFLGPLADEELRALYRAGRLFVMPSTKEGFGIVFLEAAASGLPIIAGDRGGSIDALADGALGTLIDPENAEGLVAAICEVLERPRNPAVPEALARFASVNFNAQVKRLVESIH